MKSQTKKILLLIALLTNGIFTISAQYYCGISHPGNQEDILLDIRDCFSTGTSLSLETIAGFLSAEKEWYDAEVPVPSMNFIGYEDVEFRVDWEDVSGAAMYRVRALNMETGSELANSWPSDSSIKFLIERGQLHLSLYATIFWDGINFHKSADVIIIDELPVIRDSLVFDCHCASSLGSPNNRSEESTEAYLDNSIQLYPNPATDEVQLAYQIERAQEVSIWLTDALGKTSTLLQASVQKTRGLICSPFPLATLARDGITVL